MVEPPVYESFVVALRRLTALELAQAGRIVSAVVTALAAWGLYELARRREGARVAFLAVLVFAVFPLTIRYGRAFQPDAAMLGATVAGLACWDRSLARRGGTWLIAGWCLLALGLRDQDHVGVPAGPALALDRAQAAVAGRWSRPAPRSCRRCSGMCGPIT